MFYSIPEDHAFGTLGEGQLLNANRFALDQLIAETKTNLKASPNPLFNPFLF
jgi:hypothetical protein